jgi:cell wall assembly regulator SMI1
MQQFTRALTREIQVGGERLAVTFDKDGLTIRPVGSRRPPHALSWQAIVLASVREPDGGEQLETALQALKSGGERSTSRPRKTEAAPEAPSAASTPPPATAPAGLQALLSRLDQWLQAHRSRFHQGLLPGASSHDMDALQQAIGGPVPEELRTWLSWHNGQNPEVFGALEEDWHPMSAAEIAGAKKDLDAERHEGWQTDWIPVLEDDSDNLLCLDPVGPVRACWTGKADHPVVAGSLTAWVEQLVTGLEQGKYKEDPERGGMYPA